MADTTLDPSSLTAPGYAMYEPASSLKSEDMEVSERADSPQQTKKKRKAWGQPVPEIKQILPPRKRAKTAEEKEQRKNERILRNRRAADKSRQRQKAAVADLEQREKYIKEENATLRQLLSQYQERFGIPSDFPAYEPSSSELLAAMTPPELDRLNSIRSPSVAPSYDHDDFPRVPYTPTLVSDHDTTSMSFDSPVLAPTLNISNDHSQSEISKHEEQDNLYPSSGMTQYPAVILCDLQCQPETLAIKLSPCPSNQQFTLGLSQLLQIIQLLTIYKTFSTTTLMPMYQLFQILAERLSASSTARDFSSIMNNFPLIHTLISMPSTSTRPAVFRMKLLSRLLACSPHMARLLLAATDRALQQVVSEEGFAEDPDRRWTWSSLMTIKWVIVRLEREHRKIRRHVDAGLASEIPDNLMAGVDYGAVARSSRHWRPLDEKFASTDYDIGSNVQVPEIEIH